MNQEGICLESRRPYVKPAPSQKTGWETKNGCRHYLPGKRRPPPDPGKGGSARTSSERTPVWACWGWGWGGRSPSRTKRSLLTSAIPKPRGRASCPHMPSSWPGGWQGPRLCPRPQLLIDLKATFAEHDTSHLGPAGQILLDSCFCRTREPRVVLLTFLWLGGGEERKEVYSFMTGGNDTECKCPVSINKASWGHRHTFIWMVCGCI